MRMILRITGVLLLLGSTTAASAAPSFSDVPEQHPAFSAAEYLREEGILEGYADGTFRPTVTVNRAEAIKIIVTGLIDQPADVAAQTPFTDVPSDAWFAPYTLHAYEQLQIIDGPPAMRSFFPECTVTKAEFLKMLLLAYDIDAVNSYGDITYPLASDVADSTAWFYPYMRYAITASMIAPRETLLEPGEPLTRSDVADILYSLLLYRDGKRTQTLLSTAENEILTAYRMIESDAPQQAKFAAARAIVASRGALSSQPTESVIKATVKTSEAAFAMASASLKIEERNTTGAIADAGTAWHLAEKAKTFSSSLNALANQAQKMAAKLADEARLRN